MDKIKMRDWVAMKSLFLGLLMVSISAESSVGQVFDLEGVFFNTSTASGGSVTFSDTKIEGDLISSQVNFSQKREDFRSLCGSGYMNGKLDMSTVQAQFISNDIDNGCGFDKNAVFFLSGNINQQNKKIWGNYEARNNNGSNLVDGGGGVFEAWQKGLKPTQRMYIGQFRNQNIEQRGNISLQVLIGQKTVSGYMNFSNTENQSPLCGAGEFTGVRWPDNALRMSFISNDRDYGCGFDKGMRFDIRANLSNNLRTISGSYSVGKKQLGFFTVHLQP